MTCSQFIVHVTTAGERWDLLAWQYYGDPTDYSPIIMANPNVPIEPVFDQLVELMSSVSPLETLIVPSLLKLTSPMVNVPPLNSASIVPALTMPLPLRSS